MEATKTNIMKIQPVEILERSDIYSRIDNKLLSNDSVNLDNVGEPKTS